MSNDGAATSRTRGRTIKPPPPPPRKFSDDELEEALLNSYGLVNPVARKLEVAHNAIRERIASNPQKWDPIVTAGRAKMCDLAEQTLRRSITQKDDPRVALDAAKYALTTLGKARGYGTQATIDVTGLAVNILPDRTHDEE
jgi:hypothetical protein